MLTAYVVDDEPLARDEVKYLLQRSKKVKIVGESDCIDQSIKEIPQLVPDIVFLDIELTEGNGLLLAEMISDMEPTPSIVFATAYDEYALQAFDLDAVDYLLKPISEERLHKALDKLIKIKKQITSNILTNNEKNKSRKLPVLVEEKIILISLDDIYFLEAFEGKSLIHTKENDYLVSDPLIMLEKKLDRQNYIRVHRSYIVNIDHMNEIVPWVNSTFNIVLANKKKVPVSRTYIKELKKHLGF
ncbi:LytTR family DNA-binding domain-containing protein [Cytobacillus kochii]|uniref:LytR/AlgR family response regulator transcription factor n=1 Tax=Cytobacillus kochii TaxID=859143 RepID=UPI002E228C50|nr:LytTR family DNA-binding domain-containing protein [Cytobacillus kochii]